MIKDGAMAFLKEEYKKLEKLNEDADAICDSKKLNEDADAMKEV